MMQNTLAKFPNRPALGTRIKQPNGTWSNYIFKSYKELGQDLTNFGAGLIHVHAKHIGTKERWFLGIFSVSIFYIFLPG